jgi:hypothetical protein
VAHNHEETERYRCPEPLLINKKHMSDFPGGLDFEDLGGNEPDVDETSSDPSSDPEED